MGKIDDQFMKDLVSARNLLPEIQKRLNEPGDLPEDLDHPCDQEEVDAVFAFGTELVGLTGRLNVLAIKLCVGMAVKEAYDFPEEEEEEEGMTLDEKYQDLCLNRSNF